jgi:hypothetical protein
LETHLKDGDVADALERLSRWLGAHHTSEMSDRDEPDKAQRDFPHATDSTGAAVGIAGLNKKIVPHQLSCPVCPR